MFRIITIFAAFALLAQSPNRALLLNPDGPEFRQRAPERATVVLDTTRGAIVIDVTRAWAPLGVDRFIALVRHGYYDDTCFFRVVKDRWAQFGINGDPTIAKAWRTRTIPDDPFVNNSNVHGTVAFAFAVPNGRTTQIFFNLQDNSPTHDKEPFVILGKIVDGLAIADGLNAEYGDRAVGGIRAGRQDAFFNEGNGLLRREFPGLDYIKRATIR